MTVNFEIPLGSEVTDTITGLKGYIVGATRRIGVGLQYTVQPRSKDETTFPDAYSMDPFHFVVTGPGVSGKLPEMQELKVELGQTGRDISGQKGVVTAIGYQMNGCILVTMSYTTNLGIASQDMGQDRFIPDPGKSGAAFKPLTPRDTGGPVSKPLRAQ